MRSQLFVPSLLAASLTILPAQAESYSFAPALQQSPASIVIFQDQQGTLYGIDTLPEQTRAQLTRAASAAEFHGKQGQQLELLAPNGISADRIILVGLGDKALKPGDINALGGALAERLAPLPSQDVGVLVDSMPEGEQFAAQFAHGVELKSYRFTRYRKAELKPKHYHFAIDDATAAARYHSQLQAVEGGVFLARDMTNATAGDMYPGSFATEAQKLRKLGVKVEILDRRKLQALNMGALLGVGQGSEREPLLVVAQWQGSEDAPIALVGKGITFDSGGYNIKATGTTIVRMKSDMAGAATVLGTIKAMAMQQAPINVVGVMPLAENMVSDRALRPGDVVMTAEGKSVEVTNTDAEGRLILADGLWYARTIYQPQMMVDVATLTGSKVRALGYEYTGLFSDHPQLIEQLSYSGQEVGEKLWRLPLDKVYADELKSDIADMKNTGRTAGASVAAMFLHTFVGETPWAHLDIAGNALTSTGNQLAPIGATGHGVRLLSHWLTEFQTYPQADTAAR